MNKKKLAKFIKKLYKKKLDEQQANSAAQSKEYLKREKFNPVHINDPRSSESRTPNDAASMKEAVDNADPGLGPRHNPRTNIYKTTLGKTEVRRSWQSRGNQSMKGGKRYTLEQEIPLGDTDTKKEKETVSVNPVHNELKGPTR